MICWSLLVYLKTSEVASGGKAQRRAWSNKGVERDFGSTPDTKGKASDIHSPTHS